MEPVLFETDSQSLIPSPYTRGPWQSDAQHGGPPAALLGRAVETHLPEDFAVARINVVLSKPVPLEPLETKTTVVPLSRRTVRIDSELIAPGGPVASASALAMQEQRGLEPQWVPNEPQILPTADSEITPPNWFAGEAEPAFHRDSLEVRAVAGSFIEPGPATMWMRLRYSLVRGEVTSPLCRVLCATDIGSGISSVFGPNSGTGMINSDLNLVLTRPLIGEWIRIQSTTRVAKRGTGLCVTAISDELGHIGEASQCLLPITTSVVTT